MHYLGGKTKQSKYIIETITERLGGIDTDRHWVEPFVGAGGVMFKTPYTKKIAGDYNYDLICMYHALQDGWIPPSDVTEDEYQYYREQSKLPPWERTAPSYLIAFVGFACSFGGKWFGGYARNNSGDNYAARGRRALENDLEAIRSTKFVFADYRDLFIPDGSIVYCDPPYAGTTSYREEFDSDAFWAWCAALPSDLDVFVSEYVAPEGWELAWEREFSRTLNKNLPEFHTDRLFARTK